MDKTLRLCAFSDGAKGGHPVAALIRSEFPPEHELIAEAKRLGYDEMVVGYPQAGTDNRRWRVRFFSPERELQGGGGSLLVLGALLGHNFGKGDYKLQTNNSDLPFNVAVENGRWKSTIQYGATSTRPLPSTQADDILRCLGFDRTNLNAKFQPTVSIAGGVSHVMLFLKDHATLKREMTYNVETMRNLLKQGDFHSVILIALNEHRRYVIRSVFPFGTGREEGASGSGVAALGGMIRDVRYVTYGQDGTVMYVITQGAETKSPSVLKLEFADGRGKPVKVFGTVRDIVNINGPAREHNAQPPEPPPQPNNNAQQNNQPNNNRPANDPQPQPRGDPGPAPRGGMDMAGEEGDAPRGGDGGTAPA